MRLVAGEIGYTVGGVYTSLSGFSERARSDSVGEGQANGGEKTGGVAALGTVQLALLGRWLQARGYSFWSMGHCYRSARRRGAPGAHRLPFALALPHHDPSCRRPRSPELDYKRRLGHVVMPRNDFLELLRRHRGHFRPTAGAASQEPPEAEPTQSLLAPLRDGDEAAAHELISLTPRVPECR